MLSQGTRSGGMRKKGLLAGALLGVIGALTLTNVASAVPVSQSLFVQVLPAKGDKKKFSGASQHTIISTVYDNFATSQSPRQTVFTIPPAVKFVNGNIPACPLSAIQGKFTAAAQQSCPQSITGGGSVEVNGGSIGGTVTFFSGGPNTIYVQTDIGPSATSLTIIGTLAGKTLTFNNIPNTPGLVLTKFDTTFNKRKSGKKTFYFMGRCPNPKKLNSTTETTTFYSGEVLSATAGQKCKQTKSKKKKK
ncbi:MAG TPA: hypothetical protein VI035_01550 [Solirubrobacterales bacterium]